MYQVKIYKNGALIQTIVSKVAAEGTLERKIIEGCPTHRAKILPDGSSKWFLQEGSDHYSAHVAKAPKDA